MEITQELLKKFFYYKDGFLYWNISFNKKIKIGDLAGCIFKSKKTGFPVRVTAINKKKYKNSRLIFLFHKGYLPEFLDHIDRDSLNDRIENLRPATKTQNNRNKCSAKNSSSKYLGVFLDNQKVHRNGKTFEYSKWKSTIQVDGKKIYIGRFNNEDDAALAYNEVAKKHFKEFANLNIIINEKRG